MDVKKRSAAILVRLDKLYPNAKTALIFSTPLEILVATILSAQCTDKRVNLVTKNLFAKYRTAADYAGADHEVLEQEIRSTGFFRNKTKNIIGAARMLITDFGGKVPKTMEQMIRLPGVQRKTANVVLSEAFGIIEGIAVDTHVKRLSLRLGFTANQDPDKIERDLMALMPRDKWYAACNLLIYHGRNICDARRPKCAGCVLNDVCPSAFKV